MAGRTRRALARLSAFWDASALVPLCVGQNVSIQAEELYDRHDVVIWWGTPVEIASALARLLRTKHVNFYDFSESQRIARQLSKSWFEIRPSESLRDQAAWLVEHHDLSAADALQLAAALEWCGGNSAGRVFLSFDRRLKEAATLTGFDTTRL